MPVLHNAIAAALQARFPAIRVPAHDDICYATTNRQAAVKAMAPKIAALLVIGAPNSSNSKRLVEVGRAAGNAIREFKSASNEEDAKKDDKMVNVTAETKEVPAKKDEQK